MSIVDKALETQIKNIQTKTGKSLSELTEFINKSPLKKFGELRTMVKEEFGLGHGDANTLVHVARQSNEKNEGDHSPDKILDDIYSGKKEELRPLHDAVMTKINNLGDFEIAPKKKYLSLRRKKQFATIGPGSKGRLEIGLNMKGVESTPRLEALPPGGMCQYRIYLSGTSEVDKELTGWIKIAHSNAG